jgi:hypothetical protein
MKYICGRYEDCYGRMDCKMKQFSVYVYRKVILRISQFFWLLPLDCLLWRQTRQRSPLFRILVSQNPYILVQCTAVNNRIFFSVLVYKEDTGNIFLPFADTLRTWHVKISWVKQAVGRYFSDKIINVHLSVALDVAWKSLPGLMLKNLIQVRQKVLTRFIF